MDPIERQAAIDMLDKYLRMTDVPISYPGIISALTKRLNELPPAPPEQRWIPVSKRLPKEKDAGVLKKLGIEKKVRICPCYSRGQG